MPEVEHKLDLSALCCSPRDVLTRHFDTTGQKRVAGASFSDERQSPPNPGRPASTLLGRARRAFRRFGRIALCFKPIHSLGDDLEGDRLLSDRVPDTVSGPECCGFMSRCAAAVFARN